MYQAEVGSNIAQKCEKLTKAKLGQVEVSSNIAQNHLFSR